jgi:MoaF C-terminal domain/MoaF N-terminal domain
MSDINPAWIMVGDLEKGFSTDNNKLERTNDLVGKVIRLTDPQGAETEITFETPDTLTWQQANDAQRGTEHYSATSLRDSIFFIDYISAGTSVSIVLDLARNLFTSVTVRMPTEEQIEKSLFKRAAEGQELTSVEPTIVSGRLAGSDQNGSEIHHPTIELVGKRVMYTYSKTECYEHIYLNPSFYTWHCLEGVEKGLGDTDRCHYIKIDQNLYLFVWREKIVPTLGVVMIDLDRKKTTGKILGYEGQTVGSLSNFPVGAHARVLNVTSYTDDPSN